jgi:multiple sugar transport system permease protein
MTRLSKAAPLPAPAVGRLAGKRKSFTRWLKHYLMIAPFFALFLAFALGPLVYGLGMSVTDWDGVHSPNFVGLRNYSQVVESRYFVKAFTNLVHYVLLTLPLGVFIALCLALLLDRFQGFWSNFLRSAYFLPTVIPLFLTATVWRWLLAPSFGIVNQALGLFGVPSINWLVEPAAAIPALVMIDIWRSSGFNMILLLAGLKSIPGDYYDAAKVDGASTLQQIRHISIPLLEPVLFLVTVNGFIAALQVFDVPWVLTSHFLDYGGFFQSMLFPVMDIVGRAFGRLRFGEASAYAVILMILVLVITLIQFALRRRYVD